MAKPKNHKAPVVNPTGLAPSPSDANRSEQAASVLAQEPGESARLIAIAARSAGKVDEKFDGPGVIVASGKAVNTGFAKRFVEALAQHRFPQRADVDLIIA